MAIISLGPFINPTDEGGLAVSGLRHTGHALEIGGDRIGGSFPLFRKVQEWKPAAIHFGNYYVLCDQLPLEITAFRFQSLTLEGHQFATLECVLANLYRVHEVRRSLFKLLAEFASTLPFDADASRRTEGGSMMIAPELQQSGFEVINVFNYGRTLDVQFGWVLPEGRAKSDVRRCFHVLRAGFRPNPDRTMNEGRWQMPGESLLARPLAKLFLKLASREPLNALSEAGQEEVLKQFKWSKVSLLSAKELKTARIEFIAAHPELHQTPKELAKAMQLDGLYTDIATISAIVRQLPKLMVEAQVR